MATGTAAAAISSVEYASAVAPRGESCSDLGDAITYATGLSTAVVSGTIDLITTELASDDSVQFNGNNVVGGGSGILSFCDTAFEGAQSSLALNKSTTSTKTSRPIV